MINIIAIFGSLISTTVGSILLFASGYIMANRDLLKTHITLGEEEFMYTIIFILSLTGISLIYTGIIQWPYL